MEQLSALLYTGNLQGCISKGESLTVNEEAQRVERDVFVYRAFILQNRAQIVVDEIPVDSPHTALQAVRLLGRAALGADVQEELKALMGTSAANNPVLLVAAALIYDAAGKTEEAMRAAHQGTKLNSLEARALLAQLFVRHHRPAEAEKELRAMLASDEDHPLSILTAARVALGSGAGKKCSEAAGALEELAERSGGATPLVAGLAAQCHLAAGRTEEAEAGLKDALARDPANASLLYTQATLLAHQGKPQPAARALSQARATPQGARQLSFLTDAEADFDRIAAE